MSCEIRMLLRQQLKKYRRSGKVDIIYKALLPARQTCIIPVPIYLVIQVEYVR